MQRSPPPGDIAPPLSRVAAFVIDLLILLPLNLGLAEIMMGGLDPNQSRAGDYLIPVATQAVYSIVFVSIYQATPGKMAMRIRIARLDGQPLMPDTAILRHLVFLAGNIFLGVGMIASTVLLFIDPTRRTIHDRIAGTVVLRREQLRPRSP